MRVRTSLPKLRDWSIPVIQSLSWGELQARVKRRQRWQQAGMAAGCFLACALAWVAVYVAVGGP